MDAAVLHNPANPQYLPYGEPYINQRTSGYSERFTFTGKECDEEIWGEVCMADNSTAWQSERVHFALALENC